MDWLEEHARRGGELRAVVIARLPECMAWHSWTEEGWDPVDVAAYFGDLARANRTAMKEVAGSTEPVSLFIEAPDQVIVVRDLRDDMVGVYVFDGSTPLGVVRLQTRRLERKVRDHLPEPSDAFEDITDEIEVPEPLRARPLELSPEALETRVPARGERVRAILDFMHTVAPDPHLVGRRLALRAGIAPDLLVDRPDTLTADHLSRLESAACEMLGIDTLGI